MPELLFEIGTEELPAGFVDPALAYLEKAVDEALTAARLTHGAVLAEGTPRRLVVMVDDVADKQADLEQEIQGPSWSVAFDGDGKPTQAGEGFLRKNNLAVADVFQKEGKKGPVVAAKLKSPGKRAGDVVGPLLQDVIAKIPFKKTMSWGDAKSTHKQVFGRPVQWLLAILDGKVLPVQFADVESSNTTRGHRYQAPAAVAVKSITDYRRALDEGHVVLSRDARRQRILDGADGLAKKAGGRVLRDDALLETVKNLVEKPYPVLGWFEPGFLEMPKELLVSEMREHQKYFAVVDERGALLPCFVVVAGSDSAAVVGDGGASLAAGNARVLRARFEDGAFYFRTDLERPLAARVDDERKVVFHRDLGTLHEKTLRMAVLTKWLADKLAIADDKPVQTALLSKADLTTGVVNEFPELQGIMGRTYALRSFVDESVARGIDEHYWPRHAGAALPTTIEGALVGIADRIDTIVGILAVAKAPTGSADPFGLRRAAISLVHVMMARGWRVPLHSIVMASVAAYKAPPQSKLSNVNEIQLMQQVNDFIRGRVRGVLVERCQARGLDGAEDIVDAAMAARAGVDVLPDVEENAIALAELREKDRDAFMSLVKTFKRVGNILKQARNEGKLAKEVDAVALGHLHELLVEPAELGLHAVVVSALHSVGTGELNLERRRRLLESTARLKPFVDKLFDEVMVMVDDVKLRNARLQLLAQIERVFVDVADFTRVQLEN